MMKRMAKKTLLVYNPEARSVTEKKVERVVSVLRKESSLVDVVRSERRGHIKEVGREVSRDGGVDVLVVFGGDGSLNEAVNGVVGDSLRIAFVPGGTSNVIRHELRIPSSPERAAHVAVRGIPTPVLPGLAGGRRFLLMAGVGVDAEIVRSVHPARKKFLGKAEYIITGAGVYFRKKREFSVHQGGKHLGPFCWAVFARSSYYAGPFRVVKEARLSDPLIRAYLFRPAGGLKFVEYTLRTVLGLPYGKGDCVRVEGEGFTVTSEEPVPYQVDGDEAGTTPFTISLEKTPLVLVRGV
ncbi:MAG: hypothetical protein D6713_09750 [Deltaproteobacteria bacterium]|nr:MAG: hypothetical protein D6713_09750 [Deltaproteobacteria bacterium]